VPVFQRHRIDFCCKGALSLSQACADRGVDARQLLAELDQAIAARKNAGERDLRTLSTSQLIDQIVSGHHQYLREALPMVVGLAHKVARVHGSDEPHLRDLDRLVSQLQDTLEPHLAHEETVLFPLLLDPARDPARRDRELVAMSQEHESVGRMLEKIRELTSGFVTPEWACNSYRALFSELKAVEADVLRHLHLENFALRPRFVG
jgi:regulator of cell morphogenesis and NO signaling